MFDGGIAGTGYDEVHRLRSVGLLDWPDQEVTHAKLTAQGVASETHRDLAVELTTHLAERAGVGITEMTNLVQLEAGRERDPYAIMSACLRLGRAQNYELGNAAMALAANPDIAASDDVVKLSRYSPEIQRADEIAEQVMLAHGYLDGSDDEVRLARSGAAPMRADHEASSILARNGMVEDDRRLPGGLRRGQSAKEMHRSPEGKVRRKPNRISNQARGTDQDHLASGSDARVDTEVDRLTDRLARMNGNKTRTSSVGTGASGRSASHHIDPGPRPSSAGNDTAPGRR